MIYLLFALLILIVLAPTLAGIRHDERLHSRRDSAMAFHRAQLTELDQDRAAALLSLPEYDQALLEVQRRLLTADSVEDRQIDRSGKNLLAAMLVLIPLMSGGLYLVHGAPWLVGTKPPPPETTAANPLMALRQMVVSLPVNSPKAREGWMLLGRVASERGDKKEALADWRMALKGGFNPYIAVMVAEADRDMTGHLSADDEALLREAIRVEPNGPFRPMVDKRLGEIKPR